jgi:hypothetical protein
MFSGRRCGMNVVGDSEAALFLRDNSDDWISLESWGKCRLPPRTILPLGKYGLYDYLPYLVGLILLLRLTFPVAGPHGTRKQSQC